MKNIWKIAKKEFRSYFVSPVGYIVLSLFSMLAGWFFFYYLNRFNSLVTYYQMMRQIDVLRQINLNRLVMARLFRELHMLFNIFLPAVTMRLIAEEKKQKTMELLLTSPLRTRDIVMGKYVSVLMFLAVMMALTLIYPALLFIYGDPSPEIVPIITGYVGLFLVGSCILSAGLFASSMTENQIVAFVMGLFISLLFYVIAYPSSAIGGSIGGFLQYLSLKESLEGSLRAFIDTKSIIYYVSFSFVWLFLTHRVIEGIRVK